LDLEGAYLGQGTIYPDTIETAGTDRADLIKTHHNRVPIVQEMVRQGKVMEPISELYKEEVRELGRQLGLGDEILGRHPFPGPGLGVRLLCSAGLSDDYNPEQTNPLLREVAAEYGLGACLLPVRSVGVKADLRSYEYPAILWGEDVPFQTMVKATGVICQEVPGLNRCVQRLDRALVEEVELIPTGITRRRLDLLREVDHLVREGLQRHGLMKEIWQCPTLLLPVRLDRRGSELVVIRPVYSRRAMTATPAVLPQALIEELVEAIALLPEVSGVSLDLTTKPPATIEWE
jgi:GMP synthase (glutamine-hydrolysing)